MMSVARMMGRAAVLGAWIAVAATAACGGDDDGVTPTENGTPVAQIEANRTSVPAGDGFQTVVRLDASSSSDPDGDPLTYSWVVPNGRFENGTTATEAVIYVSFVGARPYTVTLTISDGAGGEDQATITIGIS